MILFVLLCGYPPFQEEEESILFNRICCGEYSFEDPVSLEDIYIDMNMCKIEFSYLRHLFTSTTTLGPL